MLQLRCRGMVGRRVDVYGDRHGGRVRGQMLGEAE